MNFRDSVSFVLRLYIMTWYNGTIEQAIAEAKSSSKLMVVYTTGNNLLFFKCFTQFFFICVLHEVVKRIS